MKIFKCKIYCETDNATEYFWCDSSQIPYVTCPKNVAHQVTDGSFSVEQELKDGETIPTGDLKKQTAQATIEAVISGAIKFGQGIVNEFAAQNVLLGITQAGMTGTVRSRMAGVLQALQTGSLYDVIAEAKAIPAEHKDANFITNARLLAFVNKVETYLGIALSTSL